MANSTVTAATVTITGAQGPAEAEILTPQALDFLAALASTFETERQQLLAARVARAEALRAGKLYDFSAGNRFGARQRVAGGADPGGSAGSGAPRLRGRSIARW